MVSWAVTSVTSSVKVGWLLACVASWVADAGWRFARFGVGEDWIWLVDAPVSSVAWSSSSFVDDDITGFLARVDWRVGGVGTVGVLALPRGDYVIKNFFF
jgi:hypothetical protein